MRVFDHFPKGHTCPICLTDKKGKSVLIAIQGTNEGLNCEAEIFHLDCIELIYNKELGVIHQESEAGIIYQKFKED
jgi:hypothetical protein